MIKIGFLECKASKLLRKALAKFTGKFARKVDERKYKSLEIDKKSQLVSILNSIRSKISAPCAAA
jgi:hypothetical protein